MTEREKTRVLAETVQAIIQALHDYAPDHCKCPLRGTDACMDGENFQAIEEIARG